MSTELKGVDTINDHILLTSYYGGSRNGMCLQLTAQLYKQGYIQLTKTQALNLALALIEFHKDIREEIE